MSLTDELSRRGIQYGIYPDGHVAVFAAEHIIPIASIEEFDEDSYRKLTFVNMVREETPEQRTRRSEIARLGRERALRERGTFGNQLHVKP